MRPLAVVVLLLVLFGATGKAAPSAPTLAEGAQTTAGWHAYVVRATGTTLRLELDLDRADGTFAILTGEALEGGSAHAFLLADSGELVEAHASGRPLIEPVRDPLDGYWTSHRASVWECTAQPCSIGVVTALFAVAGEHVRWSHRIVGEGEILDATTGAHAVAVSTRHLHGDAFELGAGPARATVALDAEATFEAAQGLLGWAGGPSGTSLEGPTGSAACPCERLDVLDVAPPGAYTFRQGPSVERAYFAFFDVSMPDGA